MGGNSKSNSSTTTSTEQRDERVATGDDSVVVQLEKDSTLNFEVVDPGLVDLANTSMNAVSNAFDRGFAALENNQKESAKLTEILLSANKSEEAQGTDKLLTTVSVLAIAAAAAWAVPKFLKVKL